MKRILFYILATGFLLQSSFVDADQPQVPGQPAVLDRETAERNCRVEADGEGLAGKELEEYVAGCVKDLLSLQIENKVKL